MAGLRPGEIKFRYFDDNGNPLVDGKVYTYISGTNTPQTTWADVYGNANNTNPVILDERGEANIFLLPGKNYRFKVTDKDDAVIEQEDNIVGASPAGFGSWYDVKAYGATGDGSTDDTSAVQDAIDAACAAGGTVYFPTGTYIISSQLEITRPIVLTGDGFSSKIKQTSSSANLFAATADISGAIFEKMFWEGAGEGTGDASMGYAGYTGNNISITFRDLKIEKFPQCALYLPDSYCCSIDRCIIRRCGTVGTIAGGNALACTDSYGGGVRYGRVSFFGSACTGNSFVSTYISRCGRGVYVDGNDRVVSHGFINTKVELCYIGIDIDGRGQATPSRNCWMGADTYFEANLFAGATMGEGSMINAYSNDTTPGTGLPGSWSTAGPDGVQFSGRYNRFADSSVRIGNELATNKIAFAIDKSTANNLITVARVSKFGALKLVEDDSTPATEEVAFYAGSGSPEASISAQTGSIYMRHNGSSLGNTFYLKITGDGTNTGWLPLGPQFGPTSARPVNDATTSGLQYYDTDMLRVVTANGSGTWREYNGLTRTVGTTAERPSGISGAMYFDTTIGKPIWWNTALGNWVDATGTPA